MCRTKTVRIIMQETVDRIEKAHKPYSDEYELQISRLGCKEKIIMQDFLYSHEWNIGSARILAIFQALGIVSISEYVLRLRSRESMHQVINDLLETEHTLLAELVQFSYSGICTSLKDILQESFNAVIDDLLDNPNIVPCNYLELLKPHLKSRELNFLKQTHLELMLNKQSTCSLSDAIRYQDQWRAETYDQRGTTLMQLMQAVIQHDTVHYFDELHLAAVSTGPISWKHYLMLLGMVTVALPSTSATASHVKAVMKNMFHGVLTQSKLENLLLMVLIAREICAFNEDILGNYSTWYKSTIAEMSYRIDKPSFIVIMKMMENLVPLESNIDILKVHLSTSISFPPLCMEHVVAFKQLCKTQLMNLERQQNKEQLEFSQT